MKKVFFSAFAALAFAFTMTACGGNTENNDSTVDTANQAVAAVDSCEHHCNHECDTTKCCKAEGQECEHKCDKAEGKECCKKAEGKECEHKCAKAEGKECEHKCQHAK